MYFSIDDHKKPLTDYLELRVEALQKAKVHKEIGERISAAASRSAQWIALLLVGTVLVAIFKRDDLWRSFTVGPNCSCGPQTSALGLNLEAFGLMFGVLIAATFFVLGRRGLLPSILVFLLTILTMCPILVVTQIADYNSPTVSPWYWLVLMLMAIAASAALLTVASVAIQAEVVETVGRSGQAKRNERNERTNRAVAVATALADAQRRGFGRVAFYILPVLAIVVEALALTYADKTDNALLGKWPFLFAHLAFAVWAIWALMAVPAWARGLVATILACLVVGSVGFFTPTLQLPRVAFVLTVATCYIIVCCLLTLRTWTPSPIEEVEGDLMTRYLRLEAAVLKRERDDQEGRDSTLSLASQSVRWVGIVVLTTIMVAIVKHVEFVDSLMRTTGTVPIPGSLPSIRVQNFTGLGGSVFGGLVTLAGILASTPKLLARVLVIGLSSIIAFAVIVDTQIADYLWRIWSVQYWAFVLAATIALTIAFTTIASIRADGATPVGTAEGSDNQGVGHVVVAFVTALIDPRRWRLSGCVFCAVPLLALLVADVVVTYNAYQLRSPSDYQLPEFLYVGYVAAEIGFGVWAVWAAAVVPSSSRVLHIVLLTWMTLGFVGWQVKGVWVPNYAYVSTIATCYVALTAHMVWPDWRPLSRLEQSLSGRLQRLKSADVAARG